MAGKFARSWELTKASAAVLRSDKELLVFPLLSSIAAIAVALTFVLPMFGLGMFQGMTRDSHMSPELYVWLFFFYVAQYFVIFFFNTALVGAAMIRLDGGDPTVADGFRIARSKAWPILGYAAIAATIGMILRALEQRAGFIGRIVIGMIGVAWTVATFMVVPVLVSREVGPIEAVRESAELLKRTWGENLIGNGGIGLVFGLIGFAMVGMGLMITIMLARQGLGMPAIAVGALFALGLLALTLVQAALTGIYSAALYRYAVDGNAPVGFNGPLLESAFRIKG